MNRLDCVFDAILAEVSGQSAWAFAEQVHLRDRAGTHAAFNETSQWLAETMRELGMVDVELVEYPADGRTLVGDWLPSPAWDAESAELSIVEPAELAGGVRQRYPDNHTCLVMNSPSTPASGIEAELVDVDRPDAPRNLRGKIAFTGRRTFAIRAGLIERGAAAIITDTLYDPQRRIASPDAVAWDNIWHEPWEHPTCPVMAVTGRQGTAMRDVLARGRRVVARMQVEARRYRGHLLTATGVIPGRSRDEEVVGVAHAAEVGANDNASGVGGLLEGARALMALRKRREIPPLRRSVRLLFPFECYGAIGWLTRRRDRAAILGGVNPDMIGYDPTETAAVLHTRACPDSSPGPGNALLLEICRRVASVDGSWRWAEGGPEINDRTFLHDPHVGGSIPGMGQGIQRPHADPYYHNNLDTMARVSPHYLGLSTVVLAAHLGTLATADADAAADLAELTFYHLRRRLDDLLAAAREEAEPHPAVLVRTLDEVGVDQIGAAGSLARGRGEAKARRRMDRLIVDWRADCEAALKRCGWEDVGLPEFGRDGVRVPVRLEEFLPAGDRLNAKEKQRFGKLAGGSFPWSGELVEALFSADGSRSLADIHRRLNLRFQVSLQRVRGVFRALEEFGYVRFDD